MDEYQQVQLSSKEEIEGSVSVIPLGANTYRLGSTPWFLADKEEDIAYYGDVIEAEAQENGVLRFCRVVERSTWHHWHWLLPQEVINSSAFETFQRAIVANGGDWEQMWGGIFFAHLPEGSAFDPEAEYENVLRQVAKALEEAESTRAMPFYKRIWRKIRCIFQKAKHLPLQKFETIAEQIRFARHRFGHSDGLLYSRSHFSPDFSLG